MISYRKLWIRLAEHELNKRELAALAHIAPGTVSKLGNNKDVSTVVLTKICNALNCNISDIMDVLPEEKPTGRYQQ
jgi:DNA-binding Xre family transcriptional regulator